MPQREEESLIDEMRAAIRGVRERATGRSGIPMYERDRPAREPEPAPEKRLLRRLLGR